MYIKDTILKSLAMANMDPVIIMDHGNIFKKIICG